MHRFYIHTSQLGQVLPHEASCLQYLIFYSPNIIFFPVPELKVYCVLPEGTSLSTFLVLISKVLLSRNLCHIILT